MNFDDEDLDPEDKNELPEKTSKFTPKRKTFDGKDDYLSPGIGSSKKKKNLDDNDEPRGSKFIHALFDDSENEEKIQIFDGEMESKAMLKPQSMRKSLTPPLERSSSVSFDSLIQKFASLELPHKSSSELEACPICSEEFPENEFASHVYICLANLDMRSNKQVEEDEKVALLMVAEDDETFTVKPNKISYENKKFAHKDDVPICNIGLACSIIQDDHFIFQIHPSQHLKAISTFENHPPCPVCSGRIPKWLLNDHVNRCIDQPQISKKKANTTDFSPLQNDSKDDVTFQSKSEEEKTGEEVKPELSLNQIKSCATLAMKVRDSAPEQYEMILKGFSKLGFDEETLREKHEKLEFESIKEKEESNEDKNEDKYKKQEDLEK